MLSHYQSAIEDYNQAIHLKQNSAWYYYNRVLLIISLNSISVPLKIIIKPSVLTPDYRRMPTITEGMLTMNSVGIKSAIEGYNNAIRP